MAEQDRYETGKQFQDAIDGSYVYDTVTGKFYKRTKALVKFDEGPNLDSFSRLRVSSPKTLFDSTLYAGINTITFDTSTTSGGTVTHNNTKKAAILTATSTTNSQAILQTRQYIKYLPGKSNLVIMTGNFKGAATNVTKRIGQFDSNNGFYFEVTSSGISVVLRSKISGSVTNPPISQSSWNLDKLDGTGGSGYTLNLSNQNIFIITYQWLGTGRILFGLDIDGKIIYCHQILNANNLTTMYSQTATLPLRYEITNADSTSSTMEVTCMSVMSEGGEEPIGIPRAGRTGTTTRTNSGTIQNFPLISIRKKNAYTEVPISVLEASIFLGTNDQVQVDIIYNPTLSWPALTNGWTVDPGGVGELDITATSFTGGTVIHTDYITGAAGGGTLNLAGVFNDTNLMTLGQSIAGVSDIITVSISNITSNTSLYGAINFKELVN